MKILITGASGFVGIHLVRSLISEENELLLVTKNPNIDFVDEFKNDCHISVCDFTEDSSAHFFLDEPDIDVVIHLAALTPTDEVDDLDVAEQNVEMTVGLLRALKYAKIAPKQFILASTIDVYPYIGGNEETTPTDPITCYGASKLACELICKAEIGKWNETQLCVLRFSQIYGVGDPHSKVMSQMIKRVSSGNPIVIYGSGEDSRDFLYINDAVQAIGLVIESNAEGVFNIGSGVSESLICIAELFKKHSMTLVRIDFEDRRKPLSAMGMDITRARKELGYKPKFFVEDTIKNMMVC